jgi:hypothetical protein
MDQIKATVDELREMGVVVLSPAEPRVVDRFGDFLYVASDRFRNIRLVQDRHLESIAGSDFVWLVAADGHVGTSASLEMGFALANGIRIFSADVPLDLTLRQYVSLVPHLRWAVQIQMHQRPTFRQPLLVDPLSTIETAQQHLETLRDAFGSSISGGELTANRIRRERRKLAEIFEEVGRPRLE